mgnify:CR=1 FL=1
MKCFEAHENQNSPCEKRSCRYWIDYDESHNCTLLAAKKGPKTLQEIGDIFGVTRMRICQLEKRILSKISSMI